MKLVSLLAGALALPLSLAAQDALPAGTLLPVRLDHGLNAAKLRPDQTIRARVMQTVPGTSVHRGAQVVGHVISVNTAKNGPSRLEIRFDAVETHGQRIPIRANLRALASPPEAMEAQMPEEMGSEGLTPETSTTQQVGGDQVYRGGGPVAEGDTTVGKPVAYGVLATPRPAPGQSCRGVVDQNDRPQAFWLFSVSACGVYGFSKLSVEHAGRNNGGTIVLAASSDKLNLGGGSGLLLRVEESGH